MLYPAESVGELFSEATDEIFKKFLFFFNFIFFFLRGNRDKVKTSLNLTYSLNHPVTHRK